MVFNIATILDNFKINVDEPSLFIHHGSRSHLCLLNGSTDRIVKLNIIVSKAALT